MFKYSYLHFMAIGFSISYIIYALKTSGLFCCESKKYIINMYSIFKINFNDF